VHFDAALNLVWFALGVLACAGAIRATRRYDGFRIAGTALVVAALLFPYISATDDVVRIEHLRGKINQSSSSHHTPNDDLIRLYQTMDTPLVAAVVRVLISLFFVLLVVTARMHRIDRSAPFESGRSPPRLAPASY
jgi:hypothetical protein